MKRTAQTCKSLIKSLLASAAITGIFLLTNMPTGRGPVMLLADGLAVSGVFLLIFSFFRFGRRKGYFSWMEYAIYTGKFLLLKKKDQEFLNFYDFESSREYDKVPLWTACVVGGCCFAAGTAMVCAFCC